MFAFHDNDEIGPRMLARVAKRTGSVERTASPAAQRLSVRRLMSLIRFNVFGRLLAVRRDGKSWRVYSVGVDGKLGEAGIVIPDFIAENELEQYLADIFHESARPNMNDVRRIR